MCFAILGFYLLLVDNMQQHGLKNFWGRVKWVINLGQGIGKNCHEDTFIPSRISSTHNCMYPWDIPDTKLVFTYK